MFSKWRQKYPVWKTQFSLPKPNSFFFPINQSIVALHNRAGRFTAFCCLFSRREMPIWAREYLRTTPLTSALLKSTSAPVLTHSQNTNSVPDCEGVCHLHTTELILYNKTQPKQQHNPLRVSREILTHYTASNLFKTHYSITWHCSANQAFLKKQKIKHFLPEFLQNLTRFLAAK